MNTPLAVDTRAAIVVEPFIFRRTEWPREGSHVFPGEPGTWCDVRAWKDKPKGVLALYRCPACNGTMALHKRVHMISEKGLVSPDLVCTAAGCSFHRKAYLDRWNSKPLYAVAIERETPAGWVAEMHYTHARTEAEARFHLDHLGGRYRIAAVGPAIGFFVEDRDGAKLSAD